MSAGRQAPSGATGMAGGTGEAARGALDPFGALPKGCVGVEEMGWATTQVAARILGVGRRDVRRMVARGELVRHRSEIGLPLYRMQALVEMAILRSLPGRVQDVARRTGISERTVRRAMRSMAGRLIVEPEGEVLTAGRPATVWRVAR